VATVTGLTKERMLEIEAASVVGGVVNGAGHLILERQDESTIDAGSVIGPSGPSGNVIVCTSSTRPGSPTEGQVIYETDTDRVYVWNGTAWIEVGLTFSPPACRVYHNANQSIPNTTVTVLAFNNERFDTASMHDNVTNNSRITITKAGLYVVTGNVEWPTNVAGERVLSVILNAALTTIAQVRALPNTAERTAMALTTVYKFAAGDYIQLQVYQTIGSALNVNATPNWSPEFSATWIGAGV
jgi:hypothetical protein